MNSNKKRDKRVKKKIEPYVWSYQLLNSFFFTSIIGLILGVLAFLARGPLLSYFNFALIAVFIFSQYLSFKTREEYIAVTPKFRNMVLISVLLMAVIEGALILRFFALLSQFLIILGVASAGLAFIGILGGGKSADRFNIMPISKGKLRVLLGLPFVWFFLVMLIFFLMPRLGINPQLFAGFLLAPSFSTMATVNNEFVQSLSGVQQELKKEVLRHK